MISDFQLRRINTNLKSLERKCFDSRSRFAFYEYLAAVFELYVRLRRTKQAKPAARRIAMLTGLHNSTADIKTRSRWSRALRYAWHERKTWKDLGSLLRENGGPAGCAKQFAAIEKKNQSCIFYRYAETGRPYLIVHQGA